MEPAMKKKFCLIKQYGTSHWILQKKESFYHINCGVIQGFLALRKAVTTHVKKYCI